MNDFVIDDLDKEIIKRLQLNARRSFQEIAKELNVSGGTIHVRVNKLKEMGIFKGAKIVLDYDSLGYTVVAFIGINLHNASDNKYVITKLKSMSEVLEIHYTTGSYGIFIKVAAKNTKDLHRFLVENLQSLSEIQSTETLISLDCPVDRDVQML
ncbi:MAG: Lrp/AsnC ligand binding domain-containing protein [Spirochaetales bacterium]|nr:Lrp/AsnC ligand binding domain-containing protein [Spirochaetales bacterium]